MMNTRPNPHTILLPVLDCAFMAVLLMLGAAWILDPLLLRAGPCTMTVHANAKPWLAVGALLAARIAVKIHARRHNRPARGPLDTPIMRQIALGLTSLYILMGGLEWGLQKSNFTAQMAPVIFETTDDAGNTECNEGYSDPELIWKFHIGQPYDHILINSLGYRDREVDPVKHPGAMRVICMGDSVTAQGHPPYSQILNNLLAAEPPDTNRWEAFNMAVYGYSAAQGFKVFQTQTRKLRPDIVTLYYGWNDHWLEMQTDRNRMATRVSPRIGALYNLLKDKRSFMLLFNLYARGNTGDAVRKEAGFRVPPDEYTAIMTDFVNNIRAAGARPLLITAPRRHLVVNRKKFEAESANIDFNAVHDQYAELTRQVAAATGADILDLHAMGAAPEYDGCFSGDGIHFKQHGLEAIAWAIYMKIQAMLKG